MRVAVPFCALLGGAIATLAGFAFLHSGPSGRVIVLTWLLLMAWMPAIAGTVLFRRGHRDVAAALLLGWCLIGMFVPALERAAGVLIFSGLIGLAGLLCLLAPPPRWKLAAAVILLACALCVPSGWIWYRDSALTSAVLSGDRSRARFLLERGGDANLKAEGKPLLLVATERRDTAMVRLLLAWGAFPYGQDGEGKTVMEHCVSRGSSDLARLLFAAAPYPGEGRP